MKRSLICSALLCLSPALALGQETLIVKPVDNIDNKTVTVSEPAKPLTSLDPLLEAELELNRISEVRADERIKLLEAFIRRNNGSPLLIPAREAMMRARAAYAESFLKQQKLDLALEQLDKALEIAPQPVSERVFNSLVWAFPVSLLGYGYRDEAIKLMQRIEPSCWQQPARLSQISLFYLNAEDGKDAVRVLERAIQLDPKDPRYFNSLANAKIVQLELKDAKAALQQAINLDSKSLFAYNGLAALYRADGAYEDAIALYKKQLEVMPEHESAHGGLAITYLLSKEDNLATEELNQQLAINSRDFLLFTQLSYVAACRQDYIRSRRWAELSLGLSPNYPWARILMANALISQQEFNAAEELLSDAIAHGSGFATIHFELTKTLLLGDDYVGAFEQMEKYLKLSPEGEFELLIGGGHGRSIKLLLDKERKAALGLPQSLTSDDQYRLVESFLKFQTHLNRLRSTDKSGSEPGGESLGRRARLDLQVQALEALTQMLSVGDDRRPFRKVWAAEQLLEAGVAMERAVDLCTEAIKEGDIATRLEGSVRDLPDLDRTRRRQVFTARAYHLLGQIRLKQEQYEEASRVLNIAVESYGDGAEQRLALSRLAAATQALGKDNDALALYIKSYNRYDENAAVQKLLIENLYRKIHGSLKGLDLK